jgi:hypothetical protein
MPALSLFWGYFVMQRLVAMSFFLAGLLGLTGCGYMVEMRSEPADVQGTVMFNGKPVQNVTLNLQPTGNTLPTSMQVGADGKAKGKVIPGTYVFYFSAPEKASGASTFKTIPAKYREPHAEHSVSISGSTDFEIQVNAG